MIALAESWRLGRRAFDCRSRRLEPQERVRNWRALTPCTHLITPSQASATRWESVGPCAPGRVAPGLVFVTSGPQPVVLLDGRRPRRHLRGRAMDQHARLGLTTEVEPPRGRQVDAVDPSVRAQDGTDEETPQSFACVARVGDAAHPGCASGRLAYDCVGSCTPAVGLTAMSPRATARR